MFNHSLPMVHHTLTDHENSLVYAQTIQNGLLPKERHFNKFFKDYFVLYKPQHKIGGDFYWLTQKEDTIFFAMADCTGHGVSGAMLSVLGISLLNYVIQKKFDSIGEYLTELDKKWIETFNNESYDIEFNNDWMEITLIAYNTLTKELSYASAGGEFAVCQNNEVQVYKGNAFPIGGWQIEKNRSFNSHKVSLSERSKLYFFSDGFKHQFDHSNSKKFSKKRLLDLIKTNASLKMSEQNEFIELMFNSWKENTKQTDDVSLVGIELF